jgi:hypothetical protein
MNKPVMGGEQSNIPQNDEERAAALERKRKADEAEQKVHEAARKKAAQGNTQQEEVAMATQQLFRALWDYATATEAMTHHINATLFTAAMVIANAKSNEEQVRILDYITKTAAEIKAAMKPSDKEKLQ